MKNIIDLSLGILNRLEFNDALISYASVVRNGITTRNDMKFGYLHLSDRNRLDELIPSTTVGLLFRPYSIQLAENFLPWNHAMNRSFTYSCPILKIDLSKIIANKSDFLKPYKK